MREVAVAGVGMTKFARYEDKESYDLGREAIIKALDDADMEWKNIQAAFCGSVYQGTASGHKAVSQIGLTGIPIVNIENACSSSGSAFRLAYQSIAAGFYDICLVVGFEKSPRGFIPSSAWREWERYMGFNVQPANYALGVALYMERYAIALEQFAKVTVKNRKNAVLNPYAKFQKEVTVEEVLTSRMISTPLRLLNCCPIADGAVASILCSKDKLKSKSKIITVAASVLTSGTYGFSESKGGCSASTQNPDLCGLSAKQAWEMSGYGPEDMDLVQAYDTVGPGELWSIENLGFCQVGKAAHLLEEGAFDIGGKLPVNTDGGLIGRGHPLGATALAQVVEVVRQLRGEAGPRQIAMAKIGLCHSMGAGPNSSVIILKN